MQHIFITVNVNLLTLRKCVFIVVVFLGDLERHKSICDRLLEFSKNVGFTTYRTALFCFIYSCLQTHTPVLLQTP